MEQDETIAAMRVGARRRKEYLREDFRDCVLLVVLLVTVVLGVYALGWANGLDAGAAVNGWAQTVIAQ